jgi:serine/threonine protein kinase
VLDYGLVKQMDPQQVTRDLTRGLRIVGTPLYMAPERLRDPADVDPRTDIYAVGAVGYYMLTGRRMFAADDDLALTSQILNDAPLPLSQAAPQPIAPELERLIMACLAKQRELRVQHVADLGEALDAIAREHRWTQADAAEWWSKLPKAA